MNQGRSTGDCTELWSQVLYKQHNDTDHHSVPANNVISAGNCGCSTMQYTAISSLYYKHNFYNYGENIPDNNGN